MKRVSFICLVTAALVVGHPRPGAAESAKFRYLATVYFDGKGLGLKLPEAVACEANGNIVIGDTGNDRLLRFTYRDKTVSGGEEIKIPEMSSPAEIQVSSKGDVYALDSVRRRIVHLGRDGKFKDVIAFAGVPAPAVVPKAFAIDSADNLYVLDVLGGRVVILNAEAQFQRAIPFPSEIGFGSEVAVDVAGNVLLLDSIKRRIFTAANDAAAFSPLGGDLSEVVATLPTSMTTIKGGILVAEGYGSSLIGLGPDGAFLSRQLTFGWGEGALNHPGQMCVNDKDELFIADTHNSRIEIFQVIR